MMGCGHTANAVSGDGSPVCVIDVGIHPGATVVVERPDLSGRQARCHCGKIVPSTGEGSGWTTLPFFEYRGPDPNADDCRHCFYKKIAHDRFDGKLNDVVSAGRWPKGVEPHVFEARTEGYEYDKFYCGCDGWD